MITEPEIEVAVIQICNELGMNAVLPSETQVVEAWRGLFRADRFSVAGRAYKDREVASKVIEGVRNFYKTKRQREQEK